MAKKKKLKVISLVGKSGGYLLKILKFQLKLNQILPLLYKKHI